MSESDDQDHKIVRAVEVLTASVRADEVQFDGPGGVGWEPVKVDLPVVQVLRPLLLLQLDHELVPHTVLPLSVSRTDALQSNGD